jgi:outer membrane protein OmpA-like peptidoglycan-associated protein
MKKILLFLLTAFLPFFVHSQTKKADRLFENWDYFRAAQVYEKEALKHPSVELFYKLGECYYKMNDLSKALLNFDRVNDSGKYGIPGFYLDYGLVLKTAGEYKEAKTAFNTYHTLLPKDPRARLYFESCDIAVADHKDDLPVKVVPVDALNTKYADFSPVLYKDGIVFTSSRGKPKNKRIDDRSGEYFLNLFYAKKGQDDTVFLEPSPLPGLPDQKYHDGPAAFTPGGDTLFFARVERNLRGQKKWSLGIEQIKIYSAVMADGRWSNIEPFFLDNDSFSVTDPFITKDGNRIYFVSDRPGGYGGTDIWYCQRGRLGWGKPVNMGPKINTFGRERSPYEDVEGNFYFSSDGYEGFGGLDICVSLKVKGVLQKAKPLKQPINSPGDDFGFLSLAGGKTGYFSSNRAGGKGDDDIYWFDMAGDSELFTKVYTIGYRPKSNEPEPVIAEVPKKPEVAKPEKKERRELIFNEKPEKPEIKHDTVLIHTHSVTTIKTTVKDEFFDLPDETVPPPNLDKDNPSFGLIAHFGKNKYDIRPEDYAKLDCIAGWLKEHPKQQIWVEGHTDTHASEDYNMELSKRRAQAAVQYLVTKGISRSRLFPVGYSYTRLVNFCGKGHECPELMQEANRRVEFKLKRD